MLVFAHPRPTPLFLEPTLLTGPAQMPALARSLPGCPRITVLIPPRLRAASHDRFLAGVVVILFLGLLPDRKASYGPVPGHLGVP